MSGPRPASRTILTDVDQVLLDWAGPFHAWAEARGWASLARLEDVYAPSLAFGMTPEEELAAIVAFNASGALDDQPARPCALEAVPALRRAGWDFVAITACGPGPARTRPARLAEAFGFAWDRVEVVGLRGSKEALLRAHLERLGPCVWVEDSPAHAVAGAEMGHRSFLVHHAYNAGLDHPGVTRVAGWGDVLAALEGDLARPTTVRR